MKQSSILMMVGLLCLAVSGVGKQKAFPVVTFDDGKIHNINSRIKDSVQIIQVDNQMPEMETTVNWLDGGLIRHPNRLYVHENSVINVSGGLIGGHLAAHGYSQVDVSGGLVGSDLYADGYSRVEVSGGSIGEELYARGNSRVYVSGGSIGLRLYAEGNSQVTVSGGLMGLGLWAKNHSQVAISGGLTGSHLWAEDNSKVTLSGGMIGGSLLANDSGTLTIIGSDFAVDGVTFGFGELNGIGYDVGYHSGRLTGILESGDLLDNPFSIRGENAKIVLKPVEESQLSKEPETHKQKRDEQDSKDDGVGLPDGL